MSGRPVDIACTEQCVNFPKNAKEAYDVSNPLTWVGDGHFLPGVLVVFEVDGVGRPSIANEDAVEDGEPDLDGGQRDGEAVLRPPLTHGSADSSHVGEWERTVLSIHFPTSMPLSRVLILLIMNYSNLRLR